MIRAPSNTTEFPKFIEEQIIETAPCYLFCCALGLAAISSFLRAGFVFKFFIMLICIAAQGTTLGLSDLYKNYQIIHHNELYVDSRARFHNFLLISYFVLLVYH